MADLRFHRVVVTGGRGFTDYARILADLRALRRVGLRRVAEGASNGGGADWLAHDAWREITGDPTERYRVRAEVDGRHRGAPNNRNVRMLEAESRLAKEAGETLVVLAYPDPDSRGTWHCVKQAVRRDIDVVVWASATMLSAADMPPLVMPDEPDKLEHFVIASDPQRVPDFLAALGA